ncbi:MAG: isochorismatase family protein [Pseudomonadales bacterium]
MNTFNVDDTAIILIDHQVGTNTWASTTPLQLLQRNVVILAKFAKGTKMPVVLTSSQETNIDAQGPLMPELQEILPEAFSARIKREGVVNAWDDTSFANACRNTGKRNFVMAGVTTDVCMVGPAINALSEGFNVKVVCDACGSSESNCRGNGLAQDGTSRRASHKHQRHCCGTRKKLGFTSRCGSVSPIDRLIKVGRKTFNTHGLLL